ncbi:MAG: hypothetical protein AB7G37_05485 [Solirubrobacteraceae bacterium]
MSNLTVTIDDDVLRRARIQALQQGTSVNQVVRERLEEFAAGTTHATIGLEGFLDGARRSTASSGPAGRNWTRDELHER